MLGEPYDVGDRLGDLNPSSTGKGRKRPEAKGG